MVKFLHGTEEHRHDIVEHVVYLNVINLEIVFGNLFIDSLYIQAV